MYNSGQIMCIWGEYCNRVCV